MNPPFNRKEADTQTPKQGSTAARFGRIIAIALGIIFCSSVITACDPQPSQPTIPSPPAHTMVSIPSPAGGGQKMFYHDAVVLTKSTGYIKFRTAEGTVIEHSGEYQITTENRW